MAGVSLSILDGNNGILIQAKKAASNYKNASEIEQIQMAYSALLIENEMETVTPEQLQQELVNNVQLDVTVEKKEMYYDNSYSIYYPKENFGGIDYNKDTINKVFTLQGKENFNIQIDTFLIVSYNKEFKWYCIDYSSGIVRPWKPSCNIFNCRAINEDSKNKHEIWLVQSYKTNGFNLKEYGTLYGTNKLLGANTYIANYAKTKLFSYEDLDNYLRFSDDTYTTTNKNIKDYSINNSTNVICKFTYAIGSNTDAYCAYRGFMVLENNYTKENQIFYGEPLYVTYNEMK